MSDLPSDYRDRIDLWQIIAEIDGKRAETQKLQEDTEKFVAEQHKLMAERAKYNREIWIVPVTVFGDDYPTPDGNCIRDYIHVSDLAEAHILALDYLLRGGRSEAFNLGTGTGHSVKEVLAAVQRVTGRAVPYEMGSRREGDPASLVADGGKVRGVLGWRAKRADLDEIVRSAANGHR